MPKKLKDLFFTKESINHLADSIKKVYPKSNKEKFLRLIYEDTWFDLELKEKMTKTGQIYFLLLIQPGIQIAITLINRLKKAVVCRAVPVQIHIIFSDSSLIFKPERINAMDKKQAQIIQAVFFYQLF